MSRLSFAAAFLLAACTAAPDRAAPLDDHSQPIIGGSASPNDHAVVLLASFPPNRSLLATCTAVVIAPTVLVTAAHCVDAANHPGYLYGVFPGEDASAFPRLVDLEPHLLAVTEVHAHPAYDPRAPFHADLGVAILAQPIAGVTPIGLWRAPIASLVGGPARIVGYGQQVLGQPNAIRRQATTVVAGIDDGDTVRVGDPAHVTCLGDSGGPALVPAPGGGELLLGIDSYADNGSCDLPAHFRRADVYQSWLDSYTGDSPQVDAGVTAPDAGDDASDSGGCSTTRSTSPVALFLALALLALRRRRSTIR